MESFGEKRVAFAIRVPELASYGTVVESRRQLQFVYAGIALLVVAAWAWQVRMSLRMDGMGEGLATWQWTPGVVAATWLMWAVMMVAMMLPTAVPFISTYWGLAGTRMGFGARTSGTIAFVSGYLVAWGAFSALATLLQISLQRLGLLSPHMAIAAGGLGGLLVLTAGAYQFTSIKSVCASKCRTPFGFFMARWRDGPFGALVTGMEHGAYCVGCCWLLMATLFVTGIMSLAWMAILTAVMLVEKLPGVGRGFGRVIGCLGIIVGGAMVLQAVLF